MKTRLPSARRGPRRPRFITSPPARSAARPAPARLPQVASWSPDGKRIAFFNVTGMWRVAEMSVLDVASGRVTKVHDTLAQPGTPAWSPDGKRVALAEVAPLTRRFREGTNQVLTLDVARLLDVARPLEGRHRGPHGNRAPEEPA